MRAGDPVKRFGRADKARQLAGRADAPRELFSSRRWFCTISRRYGLAEPQPQRHNEWTRTSIYAWRVVLSMHILNGSSSQPVARPVALQNPRRSGVRKTGAPSRFSYSGAVRPTVGLCRALSELCRSSVGGLSVCRSVGPVGPVEPLSYELSGSVGEL